MPNTYESSDLLLDEVDSPDPDLDEELESDEDEKDTLDTNDAGGLEAEFE